MPPPRAPDHFDETVRHERSLIVEQRGGPHHIYETAEDIAVHFYDIGCEPLTPI
jgi:hypothetical protein